MKKSAQPSTKTLPTRTAGRRRGRKAALTTADLVVLGLLAERPMHGYELVQEYERQEVRDWAAVSRPHVYYALQKLAALALLVPVGGSAVGGRRRLVFTLSEAGQKALADGLAGSSWATGRHPEPFTTWLGLSIHARPEDVGRVLAERRVYLQGEWEKEQATLLAIRADVGARVQIAARMVELRLRQLRVELDWLDEWRVRGPRSASDGVMSGPPVTPSKPAIPQNLQ